VPFPFFGTAGLTDFNYRELRRVDAELDSRRAPHRVVIFDGGHEWLPAELALEAIAWMDLQAMQSGAIAKNQVWIQSEFDSRLAAVRPGPALERWRGLKAIAADFKGLVDTASIEKDVAALAASSDLRNAQKRERAADRAEEEQVGSLLSAAGDGFANSVRKTVQELQAKSKSTSVSPEERASATRVLQGVASTCGESAREAFRANDHETAASLLEMVTLLRPERAQGHFDLARARASQGDRKRALVSLRQAIDLGFKDRARIDQEKAFEKLRKDPAFVTMLASLP
jgi:hypothetical protein